MLNLDFAKQLVVESEKMEWVTSPIKGVWRKPLARSDQESGHVTSVVKYDYNSAFRTHTHPMGEEIFVLEGVFSDEQGDYPKGSYIRNPPNSFHTPYSKEGCVIYVKLNQFQPQDSKDVRIDTQNQEWRPGIGGLEVMPLHNFGYENVALVKWPANEVFQSHQHFGGEEILVLSGEFRDEHGTYPKYTWIRSPHLSQHHPFVLEETVILVKTGHIPFQN